MNAIIENFKDIITNKYTQFQGKAGGWILINLIPIIGGIWYLILAIKESQPGINRFDKELV